MGHNSVPTSDSNACWKDISRTQLCTALIWDWELPEGIEWPTFLPRKPRQSVPSPWLPVRRGPRIQSRASHPIVHRHYSTKPSDIPSHLTHLTPTGEAHMVDITSKAITHRKAIAIGHVVFSNPTAVSLIQANALNKGDVLSVARIAGIMAAKRTPDLIPLCHPVGITAVTMDLEVIPSSAESWLDNGSSEKVKIGKRRDCGRIKIKATVECDHKTGVEMEALTAVTVAALTVVDMCKGVDRGMTMEGIRVVLKKGGRSGEWKADDDNDTM
ncbi:MAG: hypothetical protein M1823_001095 [Watsoniomyces obsoletus]|nr:MAG: hypothetical protein M1823_001095 [Watsoniomyces obsoletus]